MKHGDYDVMRLSPSQKVTRDSHQKLLYTEQQLLDIMDEEKVKMEKHLEKFEKVLTWAGKDVKVWTSKKKKNHLTYRGGLQFQKRIRMFHFEGIREENILILDLGLGLGTYEKWSFRPFNFLPKEIPI